MSLAENPLEQDAVLRTRSGEILPLPGQRWMNPVDIVDCQALDKAIAPVIDIGCGPGRHVEALALRGIEVLGIDFSAHAVELAREKGLAVIQGSVFDFVPNFGKWGSALLLDGNIGIGANPVALLARVKSLLCDTGKIIVEVDECSSGEHRQVRLEIGGEAGPWFTWSSVAFTDIDDIAVTTELKVSSTWSLSGRHFCVLSKP